MPTAKMIHLHNILSKTCRGTFYNTHLACDIYVSKLCYYVVKVKVLKQIYFYGSLEAKRNKEMKEVWVSHAMGHRTSEPPHLNHQKHCETKKQKPENWTTSRKNKEQKKLDLLGPEGCFVWESKNSSSRLP